MIQIKNVDVYGWEAAIRGMRNPMNSWVKSDSKYIVPRGNSRLPTAYIIGENDLKLMKSLAKAGSDHRKYLRMINVTMDITAPLYWWKEFDTYKVSTVANSCSTMHKIADKRFTLEDFSYEHLIDKCEYTLSSMDNKTGKIISCGVKISPMNVLNLTINILNAYREDYLKTKDKKYWWQMIQLLPSSYNQLRTVQLNYEVLYNIYNARKDHKLDEWHILCDSILQLPYFKEIFDIGELNAEN